MTTVIVFILRASMTTVMSSFLSIYRAYIFTVIVFILTASMTTVMSSF